MKPGYRTWRQRRPEQLIPIDFEPSYWVATRSPLPSLLFVTPLLLLYEWGVSRQAGAPPTALRTGADVWLRQQMITWGLTDQWLLPLGLVLVLLAWQVVRPNEWRCRPSILMGMLLESFVLALVLVGVSRLIDMGFNILERTPPPTLAVSITAPRPTVASLIGFLGAGVYEETLFRLLLVPVLFGSLRLLQTPIVLSSAFAVTGSALLFSLAHHAGTPGEAFTWFAFVFRWMAGVFFAWVFVLRGFGIAVGTHTAYDILVGYVGWPT